MSAEGYEQAKQRLDEILAAVSDESLPLDEALVLYEEAVKLGTRITGLIETDISERDARAAARPQATAMGEPAETEPAVPAETHPEADDGTAVGFAAEDAKAAPVA